MCLLWFPHISSICMHQHFWNSSVGNQHFTWYSTCPKRETTHQQKPCINPVSQSARQHATQKCLSSKQVMNMDDRRQARVCCDMNNRRYKYIDDYFWGFGYLSMYIYIYTNMYNAHTCLLILLLLLALPQLYWLFVGSLMFHRCRSCRIVLASLPSNGK